MGFLKFDIKQKNCLKTFRFVYGVYENGVWRARLVDEATEDEKSFSYQSLKECYEELAGIIRRYGKVERIKASPIENPFVQGLPQNLRPN